MIKKIQNQINNLKPIPVYLADFIVISLACAGLVYVIWNYIVSDVSELNTINFGQAFGITMLPIILVFPLALFRTLLSVVATFLITRKLMKTIEKNTEELKKLFNHFGEK